MVGDSETGLEHGVGVVEERDEDGLVDGTDGDQHPEDFGELGVGGTFYSLDLCVLLLCHFLILLVDSPEVYGAEETDEAHDHPAEVH